MSFQPTPEDFARLRAFRANIRQQLVSVTAFNLKVCGWTLAAMATETPSPDRTGRAHDVYASLQRQRASILKDRERLCDPDRADPLDVVDDLLVMARRLLP